MGKDAGILRLQDDNLLFRMDPGKESRVAGIVQLPDHSDPSVTSLLGQPVTVLGTEVPEADNSPGEMAHKVIHHQAIAERAFEIS